MNLTLWFKRSITILASYFAILLFTSAAFSADAQDEWKKTIEAGKKEGKVVVGGPPTAVLRKKFKETFENRFGIELELISAPGPQNAGKALAEFKSGDRKSVV